MKPGDLVKWHRDWSPPSNKAKASACKIGVVLEKPSTFAAYERGWWVYFPPHRMILYEEDLELLK
tara:strand:+ start:192 stop:386 length:195 start_codon:yes stop_codon:yes gene_type:complete